MAGRTGQRPAKYRLAAAQQQQATALGIHRVHLKVCVQCHRAGTDTARLCDDGWQQVKAITRARNRVRRIRDELDMHSRQGVLW